MRSTKQNIFLSLQKIFKTVYKNLLRLPFQAVLKIAQETNLFGRVVGIDGNTKRFVCGAQGYAQVSGKAVFGKVN